MAAGLFACFYTTCCNLFFFSTVLATFDYGIDRSVLVSNKEVPMVILGFGTVTSVVFLFIAMIKTIGNGIIILIYLFCFKFISYIALTYYDINDETSKTEKQVNTSFVSTKIQFD